jgi:hypothetical protein
MNSTRSLQHADQVKDEGDMNVAEEEEEDKEEAQDEEESGAKLESCMPLERKDAHRLKNAKYETASHATTSCLIDKELEDYSKHPSSCSGRQSVCKIFKSTSMREKRQEMSNVKSCKSTSMREKRQQMRKVVNDEEDDDDEEQQNEAEEVQQEAKTVADLEMEAEAAGEGKSEVAEVDKGDGASSVAL